MSHEPLSDSRLKRERIWRNILTILVLPLDGFSVVDWKRNVQYVVRVRGRDTRLTVATFEHLDAEEAANHLNDLRARLDSQATADFCRALSIAFPGT